MRCRGCPSDQVNIATISCAYCGCFLPFLTLKIAITTVALIAIVIGSFLALRPPPCQCNLTPAQDVDIDRLRQHLEQGMVYFAANRPHEALLAFEEGLSIDRNFSGLNLNKAASLLKLGRYDDARDALDKEFELVGCLELMADDELKKYAYMMDVEEKDDGRREIEQVKTLRTQLGNVRVMAYYNTACLYSLKKERRPAFDALRKALEAGFNDKEAMLSDPDMEFIRSDPEFAKILQTMK